MGIYDREYYRRESPGFLGVFSGPGQVVKQLIVLNVIVFLLQLVLAPEFTRALILDTEAVGEGQVWRLLTYAFLHDPSSPWHILFNMLFLWWFGTEMEDLYGSYEFLAIYLLSAVLGGLAFQIAWLLNPMFRLCLGASGAVTTVMVLFALHYPSRMIYIWGILPVPIWAFVVFQVAQDSLSLFTQSPNTRTAVTVHLAGALFAFLYYKGHWRFMGIWNRLRSWQQERSRPRLRVYREEAPQPVSVVAPPPADVDEQLEAKLDKVLEKVAQEGQGSLTESERQILFQASEIYKRRRS